MKLKPINDRVIILPSEAESKTKGGLIIPDSAKERPARGQVVSVGDGKDGGIMKLIPGDWVYYGRYAGQQIEFEGVDYVVMREDDVLAVLESE